MRCYQRCLVGNVSNTALPVNIRLELRVWNERFRYAQHQSLWTSLN